MLTSPQARAISPSPSGAPQLRFLDDGPSIPDELLLARDQGRVVFFCGAGVSQAKAGLPGFLGLARRVAQTLGVQSDSPAIDLLNHAGTVEDRPDLPGLVPTDRIFAILEREFLVRDVETAVANALQPTDSPDLSAHDTLLDLATAPDSTVRIVTTNFDRLFEDCDRDVQVWQPPHLPDPSPSGHMNGIVYLHGKAAPDYTGATGDGFVLSSSGFGRAYLADGWATSFFQQIIHEYVVVFVGYAADDPPVQYLLEALNTRAARPDHLYAFQSGEADEAAAKWRPKGVQAIAYGSHSTLWPTLDAWAVRARDPNAWSDSLVSRALRGPAELSPSARGQIAHLASTAEGLRRFSDHNPTPPADWLCVFDPRIRYGHPGPSGTWRDPGPVVDPFDCYGIDSDTPPSTGSRGPQLRDVPSDAWDAFFLNRLDTSDIAENLSPCFRDHGSASPPELPRRLFTMAIWIARVALQPTAVWWAARQRALHPAACRLIRRAIRDSRPPANSVVRRAWLYLFEYWEQSSTDDEERWEELVAQVSEDSWDARVVRQYGAASRPYLRTGPAWSHRGPLPFSWTGAIRLPELLNLEVVYPGAIEYDIEIPDKWLGSVVAELRENLKVSRTLEAEIGGLGLSQMAPISSSDQPNHDQLGPMDGLSRLLRVFSARFRRLCDVDIEFARREFSCWPLSEDAIFARLRIWAAHNPRLVPNESFSALVSDLSDRAFWDVGHQRDLLLTLVSRWGTLDAETRRSVEARLLSGRPRREGEDDADFNASRAFSTLDRLTWLSKHGCDLGCDVEHEIQRLRESAPDWTPEHADGAAESIEDEGGFVETRTEYTDLLRESLANTLSRARELAAGREHFLIENDPYRGLATSRPVRALAALTVAARLDEYPDWAWNTFLTADARKSDRPRFMALIAERLTRCPSVAVATFLPAASRWLRDAGEVLAREYPGSFRTAVGSLVAVVERHPFSAGTDLVGRAPRS